MQFRLPNYDDEVALSDYIREHRAHGEQSISASHGMSSMPFRDWVDQMRSFSEKGHPELGRFDCLLCIEDDTIVGLLSVRYEINGALADKYGHIGYGVRPTRRRRGHATEMLRYGLDICREKGLQQVILGCYADNTASEKTIRKCGGVLTAENDHYKKGHPSRYYTVDL